MREFYVYGFKSRDEYDKKSARSYDDERRRLQSWLGDYMDFVRTPDGKNVFISVDSRVISHNPFYKALKAKSFTDGDITLHFLLLDILYSPDKALTLSEIIQNIDSRLAGFESPMLFDRSTVRKKLKEYADEGIVAACKKGREMTYRRADETPLPDLTDLLDFYSEVAPCGVIGSFLLDKQPVSDDRFFFKHHYITSAIDSDVLYLLFDAMREKRSVTLVNTSRADGTPRQTQLIPLRIFISVSNGRQHLVAYQPEYDVIRSFRIDYLSDVKKGDAFSDFDSLRSRLDEMQTKMWGVSTGRNGGRTEHVEFTVTAADNEKYIVNRLMREKRIGQVEKTGDNTYRFSADVYDIHEMIPWIRTFICRIKDLDFSDKTLEAQFKNDVKEMYRLYGLTEVDA